MPSDDHFKSYAVNALSREICALSGAAFEQWAYGLMSYLSPMVTWCCSSRYLRAPPPCSGMVAGSRFLTQSGSVEKRE